MVGMVVAAVAGFLEERAGLRLPRRALAHPQEGEVKEPQRRAAEL